MKLTRLFHGRRLWVQDVGALRRALALTPEFLKAKGNVLDYKDMQARSYECAVLTMHGACFHQQHHGAGSDLERASSASQAHNNCPALQYPV
jgi:hypothetical protein